MPSPSALPTDLPGGPPAPPPDHAPASDAAPVIAMFRFYAELNDFLALAHRRQAFEARCARAATVKHMIEALGVPHTEVELVLVNGESVGFGRVLADGDRVSVYPRFETLDVTPLLRVRDAPLRVTRFIADAHLGGLARLLRMAGFDTLYDNHFDDDVVVATALREGRIVLTRDRELLKRRQLTHGCFVRALKPEQQAMEIFRRLDLARSAPLRTIDKASVAHRLPPDVRLRHARFSTCDRCQRVFWEGSHWRRMRSVIDRLLTCGSAHE